MIVDGASDRRIRITSTGNQTAVVWNPWVEFLSSRAGRSHRRCLSAVCLCGDD